MSERMSLPRLGEVFRVFLLLGLTAFGGPVAHLAYFRSELVERRRWLSDAHYAELVALCQCLPGPASSQVGMALGWLRAGYPGALAAWLAFTLPSALLLLAVALGLQHYAAILPAGLLQGLKIATLAVVVQALWGMARSHCHRRTYLSVMIVAAAAALLLPPALAALTIVLGAGLVSLGLPVPDTATDAPLPALRGSGRRLGTLLLLVPLGLLLVLPGLRSLWPTLELALFDSLYRAGALVFGGGHVVLPLLQAELVAPGWLSPEAFLAGYGAAQAVPGPLFSVAAYLGAAMAAGGEAWRLALIALLAIFLPGALLLFGVLPFWQRLRTRPRWQAALAAVNAAVVGLLLAALYQPIWLSTVQRPLDLAAALLAWLALSQWRLPPWALVLGCAVIGALWPSVQAVSLTIFGVS